MENRRGACRVWWEELRKRDHLEELGVDGKIILKWIFKKGRETLEWINLAWDRDN
jgi:hypothetical protein